MQQKQYLDAEKYNRHRSTEPYYSILLYSHIITIILFIHFTMRYGRYSGIRTYA